MRQQILLTFFIVSLPQFSLAAVNHGVLVLAPIFTSAAGLPPESVGLIGGMVGLGAVWCFAANKSILPFLGPIRALIAGCMMASFALLGFALEKEWAGLLSGLLVGFGYAITAPAGSQILAKNTPKRLWGTLFSLRMAGVPAGGALAGIIGASIAANFDWRLALLALIVPSLGSAMFLFFSRSQLKFCSPTNGFSLFGIFNPKIFISPFQTLRQVPSLGLITFVSVGFAAVQGSVFTFFTTYLVDVHGYSIGFAGALYASLQIASVFGRILAGLLADFFKSTLMVLMLLGFFSAGGVGILAFIDAYSNEALLFIQSSLIGLMVASWNGLFLAEVSIVAKNKDISEATAASTFFTFISYMLAPPIFGALVYTFDYFFAFFVIGVVVLTSAITLFLFLILKKKRRPV